MSYTRKFITIANSAENTRRGKVRDDQRRSVMGKPRFYNFTKCQKFVRSFEEMVDVNMTKLYLVHCGFYEPSLADGIYESRTNFFIAASSFETARSKVKEVETFKTRKMHVDGIQEIQIVCGHRIRLERELNLQESETQILSSRHRDLAPSNSQ